MEEELIRVLVVDDSAYNRRLLTEIIDRTGLAKVVGIARDGEEGLKKVFDLHPDLITLDLEMPHMDGFTFLRILMKSMPTPVVVVSALAEDRNVFKALELGALDFVAKADGKITSGSQFQNELIQKLNLVRQTRMRNLQRQLQKQGLGKVAPVISPVEAPVRKVELIAIGASTGGPTAIQNIISRLPSDLGAAIAISQHMPAGFTKAFAERLDRIGKLKVKEAEPGDLVEKGKVLLSPGGKNLLLAKHGSKVVAELEERTETDKYIPNIDKLFKSGAKIYGARMLAVVLTGMGSDGKQGILAVKEAGGYVIAESERTSIVFGMPREAIETNKVDQVVNLEDIAGEILKFC